MTAELLAQIGGAVGAAGIALLFVAQRRALRLAGLTAWALGLSLFLPLLLPSGHELLILTGAVLALPALAALAFLFVRLPWMLALVALVAAPVRVPVTVGDTSANLLLPLYGVIVAAALALAWRSWREEEGGRRELGVVAWPLAVLVLWFGLSGLWTNDVRNAAIVLFFFILPFGVLAVALAGLRWSARDAGRLYGVLVALAVVFAGVGIWQWATHGVFWNSNLTSGNAYAPFYRVNSLFWDPSIYGRFLVVAILASLAVLVFATNRKPPWDVAIAGAIVVMWVGLLFSFSQSSFFALGVGIVVAAAIAWRWRALAVVGIVAAVMIPIGIASPQLESVRDNIDWSPGDLRRVTSGRSELVAAGIRIARDHPAVGVGIGSFKEAYREELDRRRVPRTTASHTTAVTVVAETGIIGLVVFAWLGVVLFLVAFRRTGHVSDTVTRARIAAGLGLAAIFAHSFFYNAFFEDPLTWGLLALVALTARASAEDAPPAAALARGPSA